MFAFTIGDSTQILEILVGRTILMAIAWEGLRTMDNLAAWVSKGDTICNYCTYPSLKYKIRISMTQSNELMLTIVAIFI
jgi:hypothetical protein